MYQRVVKPLLDRALAVVLMFLLSPLFIMTAVLVYIEMGTPIFFRQQRPGLCGRIFEIIKFRTMVEKRDKHGMLLPDDQRLNGIGKFIRSSSLDELPQLLNVFKGHMSFIGPRPLLVEYLELYTQEQQRRHEVKPGITGWAQVNGRNAISWEEKFQYDVWYVDHLTFGLDIKIMWMTLLKVFARGGISSGTSVTMEKFKGSRRNR